LLAEKKGKDGLAKDLLFRSLYELGENISDIEILLRIGKELELANENDLREYLESKEAMMEVLARDEKAKKVLNISGVPQFILNNKLSLSGAQSSAVFQESFQECLDS